MAKDKQDSKASSVMVDNDHINIAYSNPSTSALMDMYAAWARDYDRETVSGHGYAAPQDAVTGFADIVADKKARILDIGCGTGLVGVLLAARGYSHIDGADLSEEMRAVAAEHGVYRDLFRLDMTDDYNISNRYDAAICVGVFGFGPPHIEHLHHIMGAVKTGAPVVLTVNSAGWKARDWDASFIPHLADYEIELVTDTRIRYLTKEDIDGRLIHLRRAF